MITSPTFIAIPETVKVGGCGVKVKDGESGERQMEDGRG